MMRLIRLFAGITAVAFQRAFAYRVDFVFQVVTTVLVLVSGIAAVAVVFQHVHRLAGWTLPEVLIIVGAFYMVRGLLEAFVEPNLSFFNAKVRNGGLDDLLLQPVSSLFLVSMGTSEPLALSQALLGVGIIVLDVWRLHLPVNAPGLFVAPLLLCGGLVIVWSYRVILASFAFWAPYLQTDVMYAGLWQLGSYPISIYRGAIRWLLTYGVPVAFITTVPAYALTRGPTTGLVAQSAVAAIASVIVVNLVWRAGLRRYTSATS